MMKHEFEALAGYEVSIEDYNKIIEPMYMATDLNKEDFVKVIDKKRFALPTKKQMINQMIKKAVEYQQTDDIEVKWEIENLAIQFAYRFYHIDTKLKHWCFLDVKRHEWTGKIEEIKLQIGKYGIMNEEFRLV